MQCDYRALESRRGRQESSVRRTHKDRSPRWTLVWKMVEGAESQGMRVASMLEQDGNRFSSRAPRRDCSPATAYLTHAGAGPASNPQHWKTGHVCCKPLKVGDHGSSRNLNTRGSPLLAPNCVLVGAGGSSGGAGAALPHNSLLLRRQKMLVGWHVPAAPLPPLLPLCCSDSQSLGSAWSFPFRLSAMTASPRAAGQPLSS